MVKKVKCEGLCEPCQENYSKTGITMAEIKKDLEYIKTEMSTNSAEHKIILHTLNTFKDELDKKADRKELLEINDKFDKKFWSVAISLVSILLSITAYFIIKWMENH